MMNAEAAISDLATLDPEMLQLPELSPLSFKANPYLAQELFSQWLSLPDNYRLVKSMLADPKTGTPLNAAGNSTAVNSILGNSLPSMFASANTPPLSPRSISGSPRIMKQRAGPSTLGSPLKLVSEPVREVIPQFYFKNGRTAPNEMKEKCLCEISQHFQGHTNGMQEHDFKPITKDFCKLPSFFSRTLFRKIDTKGNGIVTRLVAFS